MVKGAWLSSKIWQCCLALGFFSVLLFQPFDFIFKLSLATTDYYQKVLPANVSKPKVPVIFIEIDEASLDHYGQWPWSRDVLGSALIKLYEKGVSAVAIDVILAEADRTSPALLPLDPLPSELANAYGYFNWDNFFTDILAQTPTALALSVSDDGEAITHVKQSWAILGQPPHSILENYSGAILPLAQFVEAASGIGHISASPDNDGLIRRVPLVLQVDEELVLNLGVELLRLHEKASTVITKINKDIGFESIKIGSYVIPTNSFGQIQLAYNAIDNTQRLSFVDALQKSDIDLKGAMVLIGPSAIGLKDFHNTPFSIGVPGPLIHAAVINQIVNNAFVERPYWARLVELSTALILGLTFLFYGLRRKVQFTLPVGILLGLMATSIGWYAYLSHALLLDYSVIVLFISSCFLQALMSRLVVEEASKQQIRNAFESYLSPAIVKNIAESRQSLKLAGERKRLSIFFADLRGFTTLSESYQEKPEELTQLLNRVISPISENILTNQGTIDKYLGDCVMAFWNAPIDVPDHESRALDSCIDTLTSLNTLNAQIHEDMPNAPFLRIAIGVNSGDVVVGNLGSAQRFDYTCIGDAVNLSARLEGLCRFYDVDVLAGEDLVAGLPQQHNFNLINIDVVRVKGKVVPCRIYWLQSREPNEHEKTIKHLHETMLVLYQQQHWDAAEQTLHELHEYEQYPDKLVQIYQQRINGYRANPPGEDWDGVFTSNLK